jgi:hypothetical protein
MVIQRVKHKFPVSAVLFWLAVITILASWLEIFPRPWVEKLYSRGLFPAISRGFALLSDLSPFSYLDLWVSGGVAVLIYVLYRRRWRLLVGVVAFFYLWFFWGWGLNYHRPEVSERLGLVTREIEPAEYVRFEETAAEALNRLQPLSFRAPLDRASASVIAYNRVEQVILRIDGIDWPATHRVKRSFLLEPWYLRAGIDGMFNPFGHEPIVNKGPLSFELPFVMSHEIAHVRGIANEGEANLVALLATVASEDPRFQYSGWLEVWRYFFMPEEERLNPGVLADLDAIDERLRARRVRIISKVQTAMLDAHLKANAVPGGIRSYSDFVSLAILSQSRWKEFQ